MKKLILFLSLTIAFQTLANAQQNALSFDNVDDKVTVPQASQLISNGTQISLSFWVYPQNTNATYPDYDGFAGFRNNSTADFYVLQLFSNNEIEARFRASTGIAYDISYSGLQLNTWQHFVLVYNGTALNLYHNGAIVGTTAASGVISSSTEPLYLGNLPWTGADFQFLGMLDEVSLWNTALTAQQIACIYNDGVNPNQTGLRLYYKCNQGIAAGNNTGITALTDKKGNINGILNNFGLNGPASNFVAGTPNQYNLQNSSVCPGDSLLFGSQYVKTPGVYTQAFTVSGSCDSIVELTLDNYTYSLNVVDTGQTLVAEEANGTYQWLDCQNGNTPIQGANSQTYTPVANGIYSVIITSADGCTDTSACIVYNWLGLNDDLTALLFTVSPNPVQSQVAFNITNDGVLLVSDVTGRVVMQQTISAAGSYSADLSALHAGIYFATFTSDKYQQSVKIIKQ